MTPLLMEILENNSGIYKTTDTIFVNLCIDMGVDPISEEMLGLKIYTFKKEDLEDLVIDQNTINY